MKKMLLLAAVLAAVAIVAVPALAQGKDQDADHDDAGPGDPTVIAAPRDGGSDEGDVSFNANPADRVSEIPAPAPAEGSGDCSAKDKISLRSTPADDDSDSVTAASSPGCSYIVVEE